MAAIEPLVFKAEHAAKAAKAAKNVKNIAVVANVVVEKREFLSHLQQLVDVKLRWE